MEALQAAQEFLAKSADLNRDDLGDALEELPEAVQDEYWKLRKAAHFDPKNERVDTRRDVLSPSGKYKLVISRFSTTPGSWDYAQGAVYHVETEYLVAKVQRNYGSFPFHWVEGHANGHDYLIAGEDYQGQTVVELDTGARRENLPTEAKEGHGFCWGDYEYLPASQMLLVCGCFWACPYEYRFYDFSNPMFGWPELEFTGVDGKVDWVDADGKKPEVAPDGTITCFQTPYVDDEEGTEKKAPEIRSTKKFRREGEKLLLIEEWISDAEQEYRRKQEEGRLKNDEEMARFKREDPLYLAYVERMKGFLAIDPEYEPSDYESYGITHENWCPDFKETERRWCRRIMQRKRDAKGRLKSEGPTIDLEWAVKTGPIKLQIFRDGKHIEDKFFSHSVESMHAAFAYAREVARG
jgi:hypothetical protein